MSSKSYTAAQPLPRACRPNDVVLDVDGHAIKDAGDVQRLMTGDAIGRTLTFRVLREGRIITVDVRPVELRA